MSEVGVGLLPVKVKFASVKISFGYCFLVSVNAFSILVIYVLTRIYNQSKKPQMMGLFDIIFFDS